MCNILLIKFVIIVILTANCTFAKDDSLIYILSWKNANFDERPFTCRDQGQEIFVKKRCVYQNCYYTSNKTLFRNITDFDFVLFNLIHYHFYNPPRRSKYQRYVFYSHRPTPTLKVPYIYKYRNFFNLTATYRLNSNVPMPNLVIRNRKGDIIGPNSNMHWINPKKMRPVSDYIRHKLQRKKIAAAWISSRCNKKSAREKYILTLKDELDKYNLKLDIFGKCGNLKCKSGIADVETCQALIESEYYFFLAFEDYKDEDYVTKKLLIPLLHFTVPVVYGGANYTRCV